MLLASIFKKEWTIDDYPIRIWFQPLTKVLTASRLKPASMDGQHNQLACDVGKWEY
jgi:hypothetical protein